MPPKKTTKQKKTNKSKPNISIIEDNEGNVQDDNEHNDEILDDEDSGDDMTEEENNEIDEKILDDDNEDEDDNFNDDYELDDEKSLDDDASETESLDETKQIKRDDNCVYDFADNDDEDEYNNDFADEDDINKNTMDIIMPPEERITKNTMTLYERVRILGTRAKQLSGGAKPLISGADDMNPKEIAKLELKHKMTPFKIRRILPNGDIEEWKISELNIN
jgi:DNA-directed RNA polymerase subunit K/omega